LTQAFNDFVQNRNVIGKYVFSRLLLKEAELRCICNISGRNALFRWRSECSTDAAKLYHRRADVCKV